MGDFNQGREKFFENLVEDTGTKAEYDYYISNTTATEGAITELSRLDLNVVHSIEYGHYNDMWAAFDDAYTP